MNYKDIFFSKWLKRFLNFFKPEPKDRKALIEILRKSEHRNLINSDVLRMIEGALHVSEIQVRDIMVPRVKMIMISEDTEPEKILSTVVKSGHSRFPVLDDTKNEIIGILLAKDLLSYYANIKDDFYIKDLMRPAVFIPESKRLNVLLREFRTNRNHMAIIIDEYSSVAGLITIEDVIEEIIGEIEDEHDLYEDDNNIKPHTDNRFIVKAITPIDEFNKYFNLSISDEEYDTIAGLIINAFGHLPKRGESIDYNGFNIKILRADKRRVQILLFTKLKTV